MVESTVTLKGQEQIAAALSVTCAYARLQELERHRNGQPGKIFIPLNPVEHAEYARLRQWWNQLGAEKQSRVTRLIKYCSNEAELLSHKF